MSPVLVLGQNHGIRPRSGHMSLLTWMTALNQQVFPTLRIPTGQSSWRIQSAGLLMSGWPSLLFTLFTRTPFSSALASRTLQPSQKTLRRVINGAPAPAGTQPITRQDG